MSSYQLGRTIGEKRERLETANERAAARKKDKTRSRLRIFFVSCGFVALAVILVCLYLFFFAPSGDSDPATTAADIVYAPTIEIIDEDSSATGGKITARMEQYIGQAVADFRALGYTPLRAVIPTGSIREVDFYLDGYSGFLKLLIDRPTAVSVEDADRLLRYLADQGIADFQYLDLRIDGKAFWR